MTSKSTSLENNSRNPIEKVTEISIVRNQFQNGECFLDLSHVALRHIPQNSESNVNFSPGGGGGGGGNSHMKGAGMLVVSLRGVNFGFWSHLGCSGKNAIIFSREGLV